MLHWGAACSWPAVLLQWPTETWNVPTYLPHQWQECKQTPLCWFMYGQQCREGTESSAPAAESSRNRCLACGKPRHEVMLGHDSFSNSMNGPRNFVHVTLSLDSAWLLVERQHRISPHLFSGKVISALSVCLFQRCFLLHLTPCFALHRPWQDTSYHPLSLSCCAPRWCPSRMNRQWHKRIIQGTSLSQSVSVVSQWCPVALTHWCFSQGPLWS